MGKAKKRLNVFELRRARIKRLKGLYVDHLDIEELPDYATDIEQFFNEVRLGNGLTHEEMHLKIVALIKEHNKETGDLHII